MAGHQLAASSMLCSEGRHCRCRAPELRWPSPPSWRANCSHRCRVIRRWNICMLPRFRTEAERDLADDSLLLTLVATLHYFIYHHDSFIILHPSILSTNFPSGRYMASINWIHRTTSCFMHVNWGLRIVSVRYSKPILSIELNANGFC